MSHTPESASTPLLPICKNCRHWHWWPGFEERDNTLKDKPCAMTDELETEADDRATVMSSIDSYIVTGPNFGCCHFSPNNP